MPSLLRGVLRHGLNLALRLTGQPIPDDARVQPVPRLELTFRVGPWVELELDGVDEALHPENFTLAHLAGSAALSFQELTDQATGVCGTLTQVLAAAPQSLFRPQSAPRRTASGVDIVEGSATPLGYAGTWLVYRDGRALLVALYDPARRRGVHRDARALVDSVAPGT